MITVLTPTYNRAYTLYRAYESLKKQNNLNFEWVIIDDGSSDNTEELISGWLGEKKFHISYYKRPNGGKHRAVNFGVKKAAGEYVLILDSDDTLTADCIDFIDRHIPEVSGDEFAGLAGLRGFAGKGREEVIGGQIDDGSYIDATNIERIKFHLGGDKAEAYKTSILKKFPFPEFEGEKFLAEGASWNRIAMAGYKLRWFNHIIYKCEYLEDGLTKNKTNETLLKNFKGYTYNTLLDIQAKPFPYNFLAIGNYVNLAKQREIKKKEILKVLKISSAQYCIGEMIYEMYKRTKDLKKS